MNLANGAVAPVIAKIAGPDLQKECTSIAPIQPGEVKVTDGYKMCKRILHCCLPDYKGPQNTAVIINRHKTSYCIELDGCRLECFQ